MGFFRYLSYLLARGRARARTAFAGVTTRASRRRQAAADEANRRYQEAVDDFINETIDYATILNLGEAAGGFTDTGPNRFFIGRRRGRASRALRRAGTFIRGRRRRAAAPVDTLPIANIERAIIAQERLRVARLQGNVELRIIQQLAAHSHARATRTRAFLNSVLSFMRSICPVNTGLLRRSLRLRVLAREPNTGLVYIWYIGSTDVDYSPYALDYYQTRVLPRTLDRLSTYNNLGLNVIQLPRQTGVFVIDRAVQALSSYALQSAAHIRAPLREAGIAP